MIRVIRMIEMIIKLAEVYPFRSNNSFFITHNS